MADRQRFGSATPPRVRHHQATSGSSSIGTSSAEYSTPPPDEFAIDATRGAIRHAMQAQLTFAAALPDPEYPGDVTFATWTVIEQYQAESR